MISILADLAQLLFTPMLSPAMTPMQQFQSMQPPAEVDWEQFDQNLFALTGPAIDTVQPRDLQSDVPELLSNTMMEPAIKKQKVVYGSKKSSRQSSPGTPYMSAASRTGPSYLHKKDRLMAAPAALPHHQETSSDSNEGISPVDLGQFRMPKSMAQSGSEQFNEHIQPITPSMLMSLQSKTTDSGGSSPEAAYAPPQSLAVDLDALPIYSTEVESRAMPSPSLRQPRTMKSATTSQREIRQRPIAPAHSKSKSVSSSPALGPQRPKPSPDLRAILPGGMSPQVGAILASKSNYQHIVDGTYDQLNITYPQGMTQGLEDRRTSHKAAEQKRRDHLKECFEMMRTILPDRPEPGASKVAILRKGYEHIVEIQKLIKEKDAEIERLQLAQSGQKSKEASKADEQVSSPPPTV